MSLSDLTACELIARIAGGHTTVTEAAQACLSRIGAVDAAIGAWEYLDPQAVIEAAERLDKATMRGPLHGLPVAVKDIMDTHDMPTAYGSPLYRGHRPAWDAAVVARLRRLGALVIGKTVTTEFAYFKPGRTANPRDARRTPGGSSSGSAAAVAARMVPVALGSQTAASLIRPASYCGVVGFKPSYGRYSLSGIKPLSHSLDTLGWMGRTVDDLDLLAKALSGRPLEPLAAADAGSLRIGIVRTYEWPRAEPSTRDALEAASGAFRGAGARVEELALPGSFSILAETHAQLMAYEAAGALEFEYATAPDRLSPQLLELVERGLAIGEAAYLEMQDRAAESRRTLNGLFGSFDLLLAPSAPGEAPMGLEATGDPVFSRMWSLLHVPCLTLPGLLGSAGMPVGVQLIGPYQGDDLLLRAAKALMPRLRGVRQPSAG